MNSARVIYREIDGGDMGYYDHQANEIHIDSRLSAVERRCTLEHERVHATLGHVPLEGIPETIAREIAVDRIASANLIPFPMLLAAFAVAGTPGATAKFLSVDIGTLCARLLGLSPIEQTILEVCGRHCLGYRAPAKADVAVAA